jgi:hypothetical protein
MKNVTLSEGSPKTGEAKGLSRFFATLRMTMLVFWDFEIDEEKKAAY